MTLPFSDHLILAPILLPLLAGALLALINERRHNMKMAINAGATVLTLVSAVLLLVLVDRGFWADGVGVYMAANWMAPFGIALVADRLSALLLVLASGLALSALLFSTSRWSRVGVHFHSLFQFLQMGLHGAFLTGDLFNLFVFFEVMLAASYGLLLHGYNTARLRAGMQYIVINLMASLFFLIGVALVYAGAGTLNFADLAQRVPDLQVSDRQLVEIGATILVVTFLVKSAAWPLGFWLPTSYAAAPAPTAAMMALMTKVGVYAILRLWLLVFPPEAGVPGGFGSGLLLVAGAVTMVFGVLGVLANYQSTARMAAYSAVLSSGTLIAVLSFAQPSLVGAALFYLVSSTIGVAALLLLAELVERLRSPAEAMIALTIEAFAIEMLPEEDTLKAPPGRPVPGALAFLGLSFMACAVIISGVPPLSGFIAKISIFHGLFETGSPISTATAMTMLALVLGTGLMALIALMRHGVRMFWTNGDVPLPSLRISEALPVGLLVLASIVMTVAAGPVANYMQRSAAQLFEPSLYITRVLEHGAVPGPTTQGDS